MSGKFIRIRIAADNAANTAGADNAANTAGAANAANTAGAAHAVNTAHAVKLDSNGKMAFDNPALLESIV